MANKWLNKFSEIAQKVGTNIQNTTENITKQDLSDLASKAGSGISDFAGKTQKYFKDISNSNKEIMSEVEEKITQNEDATVNPKVASYIAATLNTTQTLASDIVNVGKKVISNVNLSSESERQEAENTVYIDSIPLEQILKDLLRAENTSPGMWKDEATNHIYFIIGPQEWWSKNTNSGDSGAISLMAHHLSVLSKRDFKTYRKEFEVEAVGILKNYFSDIPEKANDADLDNPSIQTTKEKADKLNPKTDTTEATEKVTAKKATRKVRKSAAKKVEKTEETDESKAVKTATKTVRKTTAKKSSSTKPKSSM